MGNLQSKGSILVKGWLFLLMGLLAVGILIWQHRDLRTLLLVAIAIWSFCRFYYFAFYVIEHYVDSQYRFAGLLDFVRYCLTGRCVDQTEKDRPK
jgi:hypothetical protein